MSARVTRGLSLGLSLLASCDRAPARPMDTPAATSASASPSASATRRPGDPSLDAGVTEAGPAPPDAALDRDTRERAVLELLAGGEPATRLPTEAVEPGSLFDLHARDRLAPVRRPTLTPGSVTVTPNLPIEPVERLVRQNFGRFRLCYEQALRGSPDLAGTVTAQLVVDRTGSVTPSVTTKGSTIVEPTMLACVARGFARLSFPAPDKGEARVTYAIDFKPTE